MVLELLWRQRRGAATERAPRVVLRRVMAEGAKKSPRPQSTRCWPNTKTNSSPPQRGRRQEAMTMMMMKLGRAARVVLPTAVRTPHPLLLLLMTARKQRHRICQRPATMWLQPPAAPLRRQQSQQKRLLLKAAAAVPATTYTSSIRTQPSFSLSPFACSTPTPTARTLRIRWGRRSLSATTAASMMGGTFPRLY